MDRLHWMKARRALMQRGLTSQEATQVLRPPHSTQFSWERRWKAEELRRPEDRKRRPKRVRQQQWGAELAMQVR